MGRPDEVDDTREEAWADEIERRRQDVLSGRVKGIPRDEAEKILERALSDVKRQQADIAKTQE